MSISEVAEQPLVNDISQPEALDENDSQIAANENEDSWLTRGRKKSPRAFSFWSQSDDQTLRQRYSEGCSLEELCRLLQRGIKGVKHRMAVLGMGGSLPKPKPPKVKRLPVPQMDWVPTWQDHLPDVRWMEETAEFWGVSLVCFLDAVGQLNLNRWTVFILRYGLAGRCSYSLRGIATMLGLETQAVRKLQSEAETEVRDFLSMRGQAPICTTLEQTLSRSHRSVCTII